MIEKNICHITTAHPRYDVRIFHKECKSLSKIYSNVSLIVADGNGDDVVDNVKIYDIGKKIGRLKRFTASVNIALQKAIDINADVYHIHDPELLRIALRLKKLGKILIYDAHEDLPRQILTKKYINFFLRKTFANIIEKYENRIAKKISGIITATPHIRDRFYQINNICIDINNFPLLSEVDIIEQNAHKEDKLCYIGGISEIRGISQLIQSLVNTNMKLDLAGDIPTDYKKQLELLDGWSQVNVKGFVDRETSCKIKSESIAGMLLFLPAPNHIHAQPNKLFEYMAAGIPVIGSNFPLWKDIIEKNNCGICVNPENIQEITIAINHLKNNLELAKEMGENGKRIVLEKYNWEFEEKKLIDFYKKVLNENCNNSRSKTSVY